MENNNINYAALKMLNVLIEDGEAWVSTVELSSALNRPHKDIMKSCNRLIKSLEETYNKDTVSPYLKKTLSVYRCIPRSMYMGGRKVDAYLMNREFTTDLLSRYDLLVRSTIQDVFWRVTDKLKNQGHNIKNIEDLNVAVLEEFGDTMKGFEEKVMFDEDDALSDLDFWNTFRLLLKMIPSNVSDYMYRHFSFFRDFKDETSYHGDPEIQRDVQLINHLKAKGRL